MLSLCVLTAFKLQGGLSLDQYCVCIVFILHMVKFKPEFLRIDVVRFIPSCWVDRLHGDGC